MLLLFSTKLLTNKNKKKIKKIRVCKNKKIIEILKRIDSIFINIKKKSYSIFQKKVLKKKKILNQKFWIISLFHTKYLKLMLIQIFYNKIILKKKIYKLFTNLKYLKKKIRKFLKKD